MIEPGRDHFTADDVNVYRVPPNNPLSAYDNLSSVKSLDSSSSLRVASVLASPFCRMDDPRRTQLCKAIKEENVIDSDDFSSDDDGLSLEWSGPQPDDDDEDNKAVPDAETGIEDKDREMGEA